MQCSFKGHNLQVLRSSSKWSAGIDDTEISIQKAYLDAIASSQHYIYIEVKFQFLQDEDISLTVLTTLLDSSHRHIHNLKCCMKCSAIYFT